MPNRYLSPGSDRLLDQIIDNYLFEKHVKISRSAAITLLCYGEMKTLKSPFEREMIKAMINKPPLLDMIKAGEIKLSLISAWHHPSSHRLWCRSPSNSQIIPQRHRGRSSKWVHVRRHPFDRWLC
jgi:hypothetical protein